MKKKLEQPERMIKNIERMLRTMSDEVFSKYYEEYIKDGNDVVLKEVERRFKKQLKNNQ